MGTQLKHGVKLPRDIRQKKDKKWQKEEGRHTNLTWEEFVTCSGWKKCKEFLECGGEKSEKHHVVLSV